MPFFIAHQSTNMTMIGAYSLMAEAGAGTDREEEDGRKESCRRKGNDETGHGKEEKAPHHSGRFLPGKIEVAGLDRQGGVLVSHWFFADIFGALHCEKTKLAMMGILRRQNGILKISRRRAFAEVLQQGAVMPSPGR